MFLVLRAAWASRPGLGIQPCYEAPSDLWVEIVENAVINIGLVRLFPREILGESWQWDSQIAVQKK